MSQTLSSPALFLLAPRAARPGLTLPAIDWSRMADRAVTLRDAAGDAMMIGLAVLPALAGGAITLTALGWSVV